MRKKKPPFRGSDGKAAREIRPVVRLSEIPIVILPHAAKGRKRLLIFSPAELKTRSAHKRLCGWPGVHQHASFRDEYQQSERRGQLSCPALPGAISSLLPVPKGGGKSKST